MKININELISKCKYTTKRIAKILKVSHQLIIDIALGLKKANKEITQDLAKLLNVPTFYINPEYVNVSDYDEYLTYLYKELKNLNYKDKMFNTILSKIHAVEVKIMISERRRTYCDVYEQSIPNQVIPVY